MLRDCYFLQTCRLAGTSPETSIYFFSHQHALEICTSIYKSVFSASWRVKDEWVCYSAKNQHTAR